MLFSVVSLEARGNTLAVMDADLQHPPSKLPELIDPLDRNTAEFVIGSRYTRGGTIAENWTLTTASSTPVLASCSRALLPAKPRIRCLVSLH